MKRLGLIAAFVALLSLCGAQAQSPVLPGPGLPVTAGGGCASTGVFDLTNTCNDIYLLTGVIR